MNHRRLGEGPTLVLLHALGGSLRAWEPVLDRLAAERDVIAIDLPGFGASAPLGPDVVPTPRALAGAVAALLESLGVHRPHVAGNSLGGWVALELAKAGVARSVTAIAPAGLWPGPLRPRGRLNAQAVSRALRPLIAPGLRVGAVRRSVLGGIVAHPERLTYDQALRFVRDYADARGYVDVNREMRGSRFTGGEQIRVGVTVAWCERDRLVGPPRVMPLRARALTLYDCGHVPMTDDPAAVARVLLLGSRDEAAIQTRFSQGSRA
jgi:pimeloyl-ACP methyl ester carboxylesterase